MKSPGAIKITVAFLLILILSTCEERESTNPFDPDCPKDLYTPSDLKAEQENNTIKLSWKQENSHISGFIINRNENDGDLTEITRVDKTSLLWNDANVKGGIKYGYQLIAYAGENQSNPINTFYIPVYGATINTKAVSGITSTTAVLGGYVTDEGGATVTERGVCYSSNINPTVSDNKVEMGSGTGEFSLSITGLTSGTTYYVRAFATNSNGTTYGTQVTFTTSFLTVTPVDYFVQKDGGDKQFSITSNTDWQVSSNQTWCTFGTNSGNGNGSVTAILTPNTEVGQRTATLTFSGEGITNQIVTITQAGTEPPYLTITPENQDVTYVAGTTSFKISSNVSWTAQSNQDWCTITNPNGIGDATLTINYDTNINDVFRTATISLAGLGFTAKTVKILQHSSIPTEGLIAYYPFNGNANDESGNGNHGVVYGATLTIDRFNVENKAFSFDGINDYISLGTGSSLKPVNEISISAWVNVRQTHIEHGGAIVSNFIDASEQESGYRLGIYGIQFYWWLQTIGGVPDDYTYGQAYYSFSNLYTWYHIVGTYDGNIGRLYLNGHAMSNFEKPGILNWNYPPLDARIGMNYGSENFYHFLNGIIDDIRIYNRALTEEEIQALYHEAGWGN